LLPVEVAVAVVLTPHGIPDLVVEQGVLYMVQINLSPLVLMLLLLVLVVQVVQEHPVQAPLQMVVLVMHRPLDLPDHLILVNQIMFLLKVVEQVDGEHLPLVKELQVQVCQVDLVEEHLHMAQQVQGQQHNPEQIQHLMIMVMLVAQILIQVDFHLEAEVLVL
tara:strand:- start:374 stop:862 length:489 start_codon:yes stop_codon:yes gene_type:complete